MTSRTGALTPCPACGFAVSGRPLWTGNRCPVCGWIDEASQFARPDFTVGENTGLSLRQAQARALAAYPPAVREARGFRRDPRWRPLGPEESPLRNFVEPASSSCYLGPEELDGAEPYWVDAGPSGPAGR